jgi:hypothetical protein
MRSFAIRLVLCAGVLVAGFVFVSVYGTAQEKEHRLRNYFPSNTVSWSQEHGVFVRRLCVSPIEIVLGDAVYRIDSIWLEHRTHPERDSIFSVRQVNEARMALCMTLKLVQLRGKEAVSEVALSANGNSRVFIGTRGFSLYVDVGEAEPNEFKLSCDASSALIRILHTSEPQTSQPNQALQHNDPSCHAPCMRTCRASRGRG